MAGTIEGSKPDTTFSLNGKGRIILCGYKDSVDGKAYFSEFILQLCGHEAIIGFWEAKQTCRLFVYMDTLKIVDIVNLPTGVKRTYKPTDWRIEKLYFSNGNLRKTFEVSRSIRKYTEQEIKETLNDFETAKGGLDDSKIQLANRLFIAAISGDKTAREYFKEFETKFGQLDGAFAEEYKDLKAMLDNF